MKCSAITRGGSRCKLDATTGSYCWSHAPETAEARKQRGRRGGKARGASGLSETRRDIRDVIEAVKDGKLERGVGAVMLQGYNVLLRAVEVERRIREQEELAERLELLEQALERRARGRSWGA